MSRVGDTDESNVVPLRPARKCPICGRRAERTAYPFCSKRCADADLGNWLSGGYLIPGERVDPTADSDEA